MTKDELLVWRTGRNMTQAALGKALGVSRKTIIRWESGDTRIPNDALLKLESNLPQAALLQTAEIETRRWRPYPWGNRDYTMVEVGAKQAGSLVWRLCLDVREPQWEALKAFKRGTFQYYDAPRIVLPAEAFPDPLGPAAAWAAEMFAERERKATDERLKVVAFRNEMGIPEEKLEK